MSNEMRRHATQFCNEKNEFKEADVVTHKFGSSTKDELACPCFNLSLQDITTLLLPFPAELRYCWTTPRPCPRLPSLPLKSSPQTMSATSSSGPPQGVAVTNALFSVKL